MAKIYRLRIWTGPLYPVQIGRRFRHIGLKTSSVGTEHVTVDVKATDCDDAKYFLHTTLKHRWKTMAGLRAESCSLKKGK